jgi:hypothetical protein
MRDFTNQYTLEVIINNRLVDEFPHTDGNTYIEGRSGSNYTLRVTNNSHEKIAAILSVDGLSVLDGKDAGLDSKAYIVDAYGMVDVPGWTLNTSEVAQFKFGDVSNSYAPRTGKGTTNVGVIGLMVFREKPQYNPYGQAYALSTTKGMTRGGGQLFGSSYSSSAHMGSPVADSFDIASQSCASAPEVGTEFGEVKHFSTRQVTFEKRDPNHPDAILAVYYDSARGLEKRGIIVGKKHNPSPFPTYTNTAVGCTPPPGWVKK